MRSVAVVLAGGTGRRFGASQPKQMQLLAGRSLLERCVDTFGSAPGVDEVLVVTPPELIGPVCHQLRDSPRLAAVIEGGEARTDSTQRAITWLTERGGDQGDDWKVLFHDAARPLVDRRVIADCLTALDGAEAAGVVVPTADTIVELAGGTFRRVLPRDNLARCQTPQAFRLAVIRRAYQLAAADPQFAARPATDDCGVVMRYLPDVEVRAVPGNERNLKITYPDDLVVAEAYLAHHDPLGREDGEPGTS